MSLFNRIASLIRSRKLEQDLEDELRSHLEMRAEANVDAGMSEEDARREAAMRFGNKAAMKENTRAVYIVAWLESVLQDLRYGFRTLRRSPAFSIVAVVTVALSIGITTAVFTIVNSVLLRPLPYPDPGRLIVAATLDPREHLPATPNPDFAAWHEQNTTLKNVTAYTNDDFNFSGAGEPARVTGAEVTSDFFSTLGILPQLGRPFAKAEDRPNADHVAILSYKFWQERFSGDVHVLGRKFKLDDRIYVVIGVMPGSFRFPDNSLQPSILIPLDYDLSTVTQLLLLNVIGRLKDGVTEQQAYADLDRISQKTLSQYPAGMQGFLKGRTIQVTSLGTSLVGDVRKPLLVILAAVAFVLLIGCLNLTSLQLARSVGRTAEMEMRSALGAKRGRLTRQLLTENALLYLLGAGIGLCLALAAVATVRAATAKVLPAVTTISVDRWVLGFTAVVTLGCSMFFGLAPALWLNKKRIVRQPGEGRLTTGRGHRRLRKVLLVAEVALALVLLAGAGLMIHSFSRIMRVNAGFNPSHVLTAHVTLVQNEFPKGEQQIAFFDTLLQRVQALPGVESAGLTSTVPLLPEQITMTVRIEGQPMPPPGTLAPAAFAMSVSPDYFRTLQTPILAGRGFTEADNQNSIPVAIVNQAFARKLFGAEGSLGKRIIGAVGSPVTIVGVVADVHRSGLDQDIAMELYRPYDQIFMSMAYRMSIVLRSRTDPATLAAALRREVANLHGGQPVFDVATMDELLRESLAQRRLSLMLLASFAVLALVLAAVGIYGVMSYSVAQRSQEIGIRMAVGCSPGRVLRFVLREAAWVTVLGVIAGLAGALWLTHFIASMLYNTQPYDLVSMLSASALLVAVGVLAGAVPAYRASRLDPVIALRSE
jgi:putative ABC transport system permease protein